MPAARDYHAMRPVEVPRDMTSAPQRLAPQPPRFLYPVSLAIDTWWTAPAAQRIVQTNHNEVTAHAQRVRY